MHWRDDAQAIVDGTTLDLYYTGRDNGNTLTLGTHRVLAEWIDSQVTQLQRKTGNPCIRHDDVEIEETKAFAALRSITDWTALHNSL